MIGILEDAEDYKAFELSITSEFDAETAVEGELVLRLASLLWRLRRAIAIESGLLQMQDKTPGENTEMEGPHHPKPITSVCKVIAPHEGED